MAHSANIELLKEQKKMVENNAATVVVDLRNKVFNLARIEICNYLVELLQDMAVIRSQWLLNNISVAIR